MGKRKKPVPVKKDKKPVVGAGASAKVNPLLLQSALAEFQVGGPLGAEPWAP